MAQIKFGSTSMEDVEAGSLKGAKLDYVQSFAFALLQPVEDPDVPNGSLFYSSIYDSLVFKDWEGNTVLISVTSP